MSPPDVSSYTIPFTSTSSLETGLHIHASVGGGPPHLFQIDTGSIGILVPRTRLGCEYQDYDPANDTTLTYVSDHKTYTGQWIEVPVVLGVPEAGGGTGDYPTATVCVFAVSPEEDFDGGLVGIGFGIPGWIYDGKPRNPMLALTYQGAPLSPGYVITSQALYAGLTAENTAGFTFVGLTRGPLDWIQPTGTVTITAPGSAPFSNDEPVLMDTGISEMLLFLDAAPPAALKPGKAFPDGTVVSITLPAGSSAPPLSYSFVVGESVEPMAPRYVEWRNGHGINTGINVLAGADYLFDAATSRMGFRTPPG